MMFIGPYACASLKECSRKIQENDTRKGGVAAETRWAHRQPAVDERWQGKELQPVEPTGKNIRIKMAERTISPDSAYTEKSTRSAMNTNMTEGGTIISSRSSRARDGCRDGTPRDSIEWLRISSGHQCKVIGKDHLITQRRSWQVDAGTPEKTIKGANNIVR